MFRACQAPQNLVTSPQPTKKNPEPKTTPVLHKSYFEHHTLHALRSSLASHAGLPKPGPPRPEPHGLRLRQRATPEALDLPRALAIGLSALNFAPLLMAVALLLAYTGRHCGDANTRLSRGPSPEPGALPFSSHLPCVGWASVSLWQGVEAVQACRTRSVHFTDFTPARGVEKPLPCTECNQNRGAQVDAWAPSRRPLDPARNAKPEPKPQTQTPNPTGPTGPTGPTVCALLIRLLRHRHQPLG